jgi:pimeloyl-ACP methyl ester carboxylesterase
MIAEMGDSHVCAYRILPFGARSLPFIDINDQRVWFEQTGAADAPSVVLVHDVGDSAACWDAVAAAVASEFRAVRIDLPGHGGSPAPADAGGLGFDRLAELLGDVLEALRVRRAYLCGHGIGGVLALLLALAAPERVAGLILINTAPQPLPEPVRAAIRRGAGLPLLGQTTGVAGSAGSWLAAEALMRAWAAFDGVVERLELLTIETLVLVGEDAPPFLQQGAELLHGWMPLSRLARIPHSSRRPQIENAAAFEAALLGFLRELETFRRTGGAVAGEERRHDGG